MCNILFENPHLGELNLNFNLLFEKRALETDLRKRENRKIDLSRPRHEGTYLHKGDENRTKRIETFPFTCIKILTIREYISEFLFS